MTPALSRPWVIYGAGGFGRNMAGLIEAAGGSVRGFVDRSPRPDSVEIRALDDAGAWVDSPVAVGLCNPEADIVEVIESLGKVGFTEVVTPVQMYAALGKRGIDHVNYWLTTDVALLDREQAAIQQARNLFADERSRSIFDALIEYRRVGDPHVLPPHDPLHDQYVPADLPFMIGSVRLVDCGAYDGDTLRAALKSGIAVEAAIALEPDPDNFAALIDWIKDSHFAAVMPLPLGAAHETSQLRFAADGTSAAAVSATGDVFIQCVALDDILNGWAPTHVKMDIEGAEASALHGMRRTLERDRPALAISLYHRPADLWELPLLVKHLRPRGYSYHVRVYANQGFETVLYVIPDEQA